MPFLYKHWNKTNFGDLVHKQVGPTNVVKKDEKVIEEIIQEIEVKTEIFEQNICKSNKKINKVKINKKNKRNKK